MNTTGKVNLTLGPSVQRGARWPSPSDESNGSNSAATSLRVAFGTSELSTIVFVFIGNLPYHCILLKHAKSMAYDELYEELDTKEGEKTLYRLARQRHQAGKDVQQLNRSE